MKAGMPLYPTHQSSVNQNFATTVALHQPDLRPSGLVRGISAPPGSGVWIARENETVLPGKIRVAVAQVQMEAIARESNTGIPVRVGGQGESAQRQRLVTEPEITGACGKRRGYALQDLRRWKVDADTGCGVLRLSQSAPWKGPGSVTHSVGRRAIITCGTP
jgi:hypothetical protein